MDPIERLFEGVDLVTPFRVIEEIGLRPDDTLVTRPKTNLKRLVLDRAETTRRLRTLEDLYGSWTVEEETELDHARREMWNSWQSRS
jgi:hypothetical protein